MPPLNPLIQRFIYSRLRVRALVFWLTATLLVVGFVFAMTYLVAKEQSGVDPVTAARGTLLPLILIQGFILMLLGTGTLASGITQDRLDGTIDYQRMAPMPPWKKILGYLFGVPVREYLMFAVTLPFLLFALIRGQVPFGAWFPFYLIFFCSVWLYHMTGFAAAMITRRWRWAARIAQGLVIALYLILPQFSHFGIVIFEYLTVRPAFFQHVIPLLKNSGAVDDLPGAGKVPLFQLQLSATVYSLIVQAGLLLLFYRAIERKWQQESAPALGKIGGPLAFACVLVVALGNLWPRLLDPTAGPSLPGAPPPTLIALPLAFAVLGLIVGLMVLRIISPERLDYRRGLLRCRKLGWTNTPLWLDEASARPHAFGFALLLGGLSWFIFHVMRGAGFYESHPELWAPFGLPLALMATLLYFHGTREFLGQKNQILFGLLVWILPVLLALVITAASLELRTLAYFVLVVSPWGLVVLSAAGPLLALGNAEAADIVRLGYARAFGLTLIAVLAAFFQIKLWLWQRAERERVGR